MSNDCECQNLEIKETANKTDYVQMITNLSLTFSLLLIFIIKILKFIFYKKKINMKQNKLLLISSSSTI